MDYEKTGKVIADGRRKKNLTQKQLAERIRVSDRTVSKWECGKGFPDPSLLEPLSDALEIPLLDLVRGERVEIQPDEELRFREGFRILLCEGKKRAAGICKRLLGIGLLLLIGGELAFFLHTGGDGLHRWEWVREIRTQYERECAGYSERGVYRAEWISGDKRIVMTDTGAIEELLAQVSAIRLGEEYKNWGPGAVSGYLILTTEDGEMADSRFVLQFPAFTISAGIGDAVGRTYSYEASIQKEDAFTVLNDTICRFADEGRAVRHDLGA